MRTKQWLVLLIWLAGTGLVSAADRLVERHCLDCHDGDSEKGGLNLESLPPSDLAAWTQVYDRVAAGEMPPANKRQPTAAEKERFLGGLRLRLSGAWKERYRVSGRVRGRRLNPTEYENTLRDLLKAPWLELKEMLPPDPEKHGFDNVAEAQEISYVQMARYLEAAEVALDGAMRLHPAPEPRTVRFRFGDGRILGKGKLRGKGTGDTRLVNEWIVFLRQPNSAQAPWRISNKRQMEAGWYRYRVRCRGVLYDHGKLRPPERGQVAAINTAAKRFIGVFDCPDEPGIVEFTGWQHQHDLLEFFCATLDDRNAKNAKTDPDSPYRAHGIAFDWIEFDGPYPTKDCDSIAWPSESYRTLFDDLPMERWTEESGLQRPERLHLPDWTANKRGLRDAFQEPPGLMMVVPQNPRADAERLLRDFMARAYRRKPEESEVKRCLGFALAGIERKACFQDAMRPAFQSVLCSPDFLYLHESPGRLDNDAMASRLSYFLWRTLPDAELREQDLSSDEVIQRQLDRMLADARSKRFVSDFTGQWLDLRKVHDTSPDRYLFPEYFCDVHLVDSAVAETEATFAEMLRQDLPAIIVVKSDFVMVNERLAELYDLTGVRGRRIRRVSLPAGSSRGGFLTQSSVLKVTANGLTTSPVIRGAWVLDRILGQPPSAPPPDAGAIEPDTRGATTIRQLLAQHRRNESCASCHKSIDPPGLTLENFDVMGAWRERYRSFEHGDEIKRTVANRPVRYKLGLPVDPSGVTEEGQKFKDIHEFRDYLLGQEEQIARNLVERLLTFATGAGVSFADREVVDKILKQTKATSYGLRSIVRSIVASETFRSK